MTGTGFVREVKGNMANVRFFKESACGGNCSACGGCKSKPIDRWIENTLALSVGDKVEVESSSKDILLSSFILYILPLIMFFTAYIICFDFFSEAISLIAGVIAFFLSFLIARKYGNKLNIKFEMVKKVL